MIEKKNDTFIDALILIIYSVTVGNDLLVEMYLDM